MNSQTHNLDGVTLHARRNETFRAARQPGTLPHVVDPAPYVTIRLAAAVTGMTQKAIRRKIERGVWQEGREFRRADGRVFINMEGFRKWVEKAQA
jgi:hypothetical protein